MSEKSAEFANQFSTIFKRASETAIKEKAQLTKNIETLESQRQDIDNQIADLEKQLQEVDGDIAVGLKIAAKSAGVKLSLDGAKPTRTGTGRKRMSKDEMEKAIGAIMKALPGKTGKFVPVAEIADKASLDIASARSVLQKLKREEKAENNGVRGSGGGWRKSG